MLILSLKLTNQIDCGSLCQKIQEAFHKIGPISDPHNKVLTINLNDIIDSQEISQPLAIEYKPDC